jgi:hypothetical protein
MQTFVEDNSFCCFGSFEESGGEEMSDVNKILGQLVNYASNYFSTLYNSQRAKIGEVRGMLDGSGDHTYLARDALGGVRNGIRMLEDMFQTISAADEAAGDRLAKDHPIQRLKKEYQNACDEYNAKVGDERRIRK